MPLRARAGVYVLVCVLLPWLFVGLFLPSVTEVSNKVQTCMNNHANRGSEKIAIKKSIFGRKSGGISAKNTCENPRENWRGNWRGNRRKNDAKIRKHMRKSVVVAIFNCSYLFRATITLDDRNTFVDVEHVRDVNEFVGKTYVEIETTCLTSNKFST